MGKIKAASDRNILVLLLFKKGLAKEFSKLIEKGSVEFYSSEEILGELARVLTYPKIEEVFKKTGIDKTTALESLVEILKIVNPKVKIDAIKRDSIDNKALECALEAGAKYVVSGDKHLLELKKFRKTEILSAREFLESARALNHVFPHRGCPGEAEGIPAVNRIPADNRGFLASLLASKLVSI